jgi:hypothetical protein
VAKAANYDRILTEQIDKLEEKKLNDIKVVFSCYIEELNCKNTFLLESLKRIHTHSNHISRKSS